VAEAFRHDVGTCTDGLSLCAVRVPEVVKTERAGPGPVAQFTTAGRIAARSSLPLASEPVDAKAGVPSKVK
jgi:hypothetical protein